MNIKEGDILIKFEIGHLVKLASNPEIIFEIIAINCDHTYAIQVKDNKLPPIKYDHVSGEMLKLATDCGEEI